MTWSFCSGHTFFVSLKHYLYLFWILILLICRVYAESFKSHFMPGAQPFPDCITSALKWGITSRKIPYPGLWTCQTQCIISISFPCKPISSFAYDIIVSLLEGSLCRQMGFRVEKTKVILKQNWTLSYRCYVNQPTLVSIWQQQTNPPPQKKKRKCRNT